MSSWNFLNVLVTFLSLTLWTLNLASCCKLQVLPESFCKLSKLRYLNLSYFMRLDKIPSSFGGLKLQSLDISSAVSLNALPDSIADLTTLSNFEAIAVTPNVIASIQKIQKHLNFPWITEHVVHQIKKMKDAAVYSLMVLTPVSPKLCRKPETRFQSTCFPFFAGNSEYCWQKMLFC